MAHKRKLDTDMPCVIAKPLFVPYKLSSKNRPTTIHISKTSIPSSGVLHRLQGSQPPLTILLYVPCMCSVHEMRNLSVYQNPMRM